MKMRKTFILTLATAFVYFSGYAMDRFSEQYVETLFKPIMTVIPIKDAILQDNSIHETLDKTDVNDEIISSCLNTMVYLYKLLGSESVNFDSCKQSSQDNGIKSMIETLEIRLFDMCLYYYESQGEENVETKSNILYEQMVEKVKNRLRG